MLALSILFVFACKTPSAALSEKPASIKTSNSTPQYEKGVLVIQLKDGYKASLPNYDKDSPSLGEYPYLGGLLATYKVSSIASFIPQETNSRIGKFYKILYDESISPNDFIEALKKIEIIQNVEKSPVNKHK